MLVDRLRRADAVQLGRSVGGDTTSGTKASEASATQACSSAAAVPLVTTMATGRSVASARPSAKNPALRSSRRTCTLQLGRDARTRGRAASSEIRERGRRRAVPARSTRQRASPRTWPAPRWGSVRSVAMSLLGVQRDGSGPTLVWLHGFTQTKDRPISSVPFWQDVRGADHRPARPRRKRAHSRVARRDGRPARRGAPRRALRARGLLLGGRVALHVALRHPERLSGLVLLGATRGHRGRDERERASTPRRGARDRIEDHRDRGVPRRVARPADVRVAAPRPARTCGAQPRREGPRELAAPARHRDPSVARARARGARRCPTLCSPGDTTTKFSRRSRAPSPTDVRTGQCAIVADAAHAAHLEQPERRRAHW